MPFTESVKNVLTLGGHKRLAASQATYEEEFARYSLERSQVVETNNDVQGKLVELGQVTIRSMKDLRRAHRALGLRSNHSGGQGSISKGKTDRSRDEVEPQIAELLKRFSSATSVVHGIGMGSAVAAGSWSAVAVMGTASTGTAIGSLSGVAATNAIWAWFGGGALAAGGAGMAGGALVLGGLFLAPAVLFASWHSRSKIKEIEAETGRIITAALEMREVRSSLGTQHRSLTSAIDAVSVARLAFVEQTEEIFEALFPWPVVSFGWRWVRKLLFNGSYSPAELPILSQLELSSSALLATFAHSGFVQNVGPDR